MSRYSHLALCLLTAVGGLLSPLAAPAAEKVVLFNGKDLTGWKTFLDPNAKEADPAKVWSVSDGVIHCVGRPAGYLLTDHDYDNYILRLQWRWPAKGGNSGVFVHVVGPDEIWPKGIEAQLQSGAAGDFWLVGGAKLKIDEERHDKNNVRHYYRFKTAKKVENPEGEWNQYEIKCVDNKIDLIVNGQLVNQGLDGELSKGKILLQSEGTPIEFRDIELEPLN